MRGWIGVSQSTPLLFPTRYTRYATRSMLESANLREPLHQFFLLRRQLVRHNDLHFDNQVANRFLFANALLTNAEAFSARRTGGNLQRDLRALQRLDAHLRPERRLRDVDRHRRNEIESFALEEPVGLHAERDDEIA